MRIRVIHSGMLIFGAALLAAAVGAASREAALKSLADAERAFAKMSVAEGLRKSFLANFTEEGISFGPAPQRSNEALRKRPAPAGKEPFTLDWWPVYSDVSAAGDLGFNTGPYEVTDDAGKNPPNFGYFFSVWKKQPDGSWKVVLDVGVHTPARGDRDPRGSWKAAQGPRFQPKSPVVTPVEAERLKRVDAVFSSAVATRGLRQAYQKTLDAEARLHRNDIFPLTDPAAITAQLAKEEEKGAMTCSPMFADIASSADLGYSYGNYTITKKGETTPAEKGSYARIWRRHANGEWKLTVEIVSPWPVERVAE
ncbi:MAG: hypothetical protein HYX26_10240 [Acidobacteriales bacterium]|nr:hypothetical protein [Terriglobales bacterium]